MKDTESEDGFENLDEDDQAYLNRVSNALDGYTYLEEWQDQYAKKDPAHHYRAFNEETGQLKRAIEKFGYSIVLEGGKPVKRSQGGLTAVLCKLPLRLKHILDSVKNKKADAEVERTKQVTRMNADHGGNLTKI